MAPRELPLSHTSSHSAPPPSRPCTGDGGPATLALLNGPVYARVRPRDGAVVIIDVFQNFRIRAVARNGTITTIAGDGHYGGCANTAPPVHLRVVTSHLLTTRCLGAGFQDAVDPLQAEFRGANDVAFDASGSMLVCDSENHRIRKMDGATGAVTTIAGNGDMGYNVDVRGGTDTAAVAPPPTSRVHVHCARLEDATAGHRRRHRQALLSVRRRGCP